MRSVLQRIRQLLDQPQRSVDPRAECFRIAFVERFGPPTASKTIYRDTASPTIDLETYRAPWDSNVHVFSTVGLSRYTGPLIGPAEILLFVDDHFREAAEAFHRIVSLLADEPAAFGIGALYSGTRSFGALASKHGKVAMVLTDLAPVTGMFHVDCGGDQGHVFILALITEPERRLLEAEGWESLSDRLAGVDLSSVHRPSTV
jgi:hypothetical protein